MVFVIRLRDRQGMKRLVFASADTATWYELRQQVCDVAKLPMDEQYLSRQPMNQPDFVMIEPTDRVTTLAQLGFQNGDILYAATLDDSSSASSSSSPSLSSSSTSSSTSSSSSLARSVIPATTPHIPPHKLTSRCQHGPRGACAHCLPAVPGAKVTGKCNHGPTATCMHCSSYVKKAGNELATWLCNHPDTAFCPKCMPPEDPDAAKQPRCSCDRAKGQKCIQCVDKAPTIKVDVIPYARYLSDKQGLCKYKHGPTTTCAFCAPDPFPSFAAKPNCDKGHLPYPKGVCLSCAPPNAILRPQTYRHVDSLSIEARVLQPFYTGWTRQGVQKQRCAILFGRYAPEPADTNNPGAIRAQVVALYEPPQTYTPLGVEFTRDEREKTVHQVAEWLGLEPVGWVVTTVPRFGEKYGGKVLMAGWEVKQAAAFQARYKNDKGFSRFATVVIEHAEQVEPVAYQVADLAVALHRENAFRIDAAGDPFMLKTRVPNKEELMPTIVYKDRPLQPGVEFLPDELLVKVNLTSPLQNDPMLRHFEFPPTAGDVMLKAWNQQYQREEYRERLADFGLLVALVAVVGGELVREVCQALKTNASFSPALRSKLDSALLARQLL